MAMDRFENSPDPPTVNDAVNRTASMEGLRATILSLHHVDRVLIALFLSNVPSLSRMSRFH
jgi:hypothetical protein